MNVIISPNIKRQSDRINPNGEVIDPRTRQVIKHSVPEYVPTAEDIRVLEEKSAQSAVQSPVEKENPLADMIRTQVQNAVKEAIKDIDISKMVAEAIKGAFSGK